MCPSLDEDFVVHTTTEGIQDSADVAVHDQGFVVVWRHIEVENFVRTEVDIQARRFDRLGRPIGTAFQVSDSTSDYLSAPAVASWPDGRFVVVWREEDRRIRGSAFEAEGIRAGSELLVQTVDYDRLRDADIATQDGRAVVVWSGPGKVGNPAQVWGRQLDPDGFLNGEAFQISELTTGDAGAAAIRTAPDAELLVTYPVFDVADEVRMRPLDVDGMPASAELLVQALTSRASGQSAVDFAADGRFVVTWQTYSDSQSNGAVMARRFAADYSADGSSIEVVPESASPFLYDVAVEPNGDFVVAAWHGSLAGVFGEEPLRASRVLARDTDVVEAQPIPSAERAVQGGAKIDSNHRGGLVAVWAAGPSHDQLDVRARLFTTEPVFWDGFESGGTGCWSVALGAPRLR